MSPSRPIGVKILVSTYVILIIGFSYLFFILGMSFSGDGKDIEEITNFFFIKTAITLIIIESLLILIPSGFIIWGLWNGKNWARIITIILNALIALLFLAFLILQADSLQKIFRTLLFLIPSATILAYLLFNKKAKEFYK